MTRINKIFLSICYLILTCSLSGCKLIILDPKGSVATDEKNIIVLSVLLMLIVVLPVIVLTIVFAWRYRATNTKAVYAPNWSHSTLLEIICWTVPCIIIAILGGITWISSHQLDPYKPLAVNKKPITIEAISLQWKWLFIYPEQNIATINEIRFPVDVPVKFIISAEGPMNSFQIPQLGGQIYAMAGMKTKLNLIANEVGEYLGISANLTGEGFSNMQFKVTACTQDQFNQWVKTARLSPENLTINKYNQLIRPSLNNTIQYFSSANEKIFNNVVMKGMLPMECV